MTNKTAARRYARALFDVGVAEKADLEQIERDLAEFGALFDQHPALAQALLNPAVPAPRKRAAVVELTSRANVAGVVAKLLALLAERDRLVLLPDVLAAYRDRLLETQNVVRAEVTTAAPLEPNRAQAIERALAEATRRRVTMTAFVDPAIVGGVIARVGSTVFDGSVTRQLEKIRQRLEAGG
jgi:F-type H+-transporting ATPase subunit delta